MYLFFSIRRRHTRCALVTGVQTCALPISALAALPLEFSPGERWNYSVSTDVLSVVVERLGGLDLERCFQERIFDPLGMPDTFFELPEDRVERMTDAWQDRKSTRLNSSH